MNGKSNLSFEEVFTKPVIKIGRITLAIAIIASFLPSLYLWIFHSAAPPSLEVALRAWLMIATLFGAMYIVEPISYYTVLGTVGTYMSFLAGNIGNMRLPCSAVAQEAVGVEPNTKEAEIISALGIAGSIITNQIVLTLGIITGALILGVLPKVVLTAFNYVVPAIFGAVFFQFAYKNISIGIIALIIPIAIKFLWASIPAWLLIIICVFGTIAISRFIYVRTSKTI